MKRSLEAHLLSRPAAGRLPHLICRDNACQGLARRLWSTTGSPAHWQNRKWDSQSLQNWRSDLWKHLRKRPGNRPLPNRLRGQACGTRA